MEESDKEKTEGACISRKGLTNAEGFHLDVPHNEGANICGAVVDDYVVGHDHAAGPAGFVTVAVCCTRLIVAESNTAVHRLDRDARHAASVRPLLPLKRMGRGCERLRCRGRPVWRWRRHDRGRDRTGILLAQVVVPVPVRALDHHFSIVLVSVAESVLGSDLAVRISFPDPTAAARWLVCGRRLQREGLSCWRGRASVGVVGGGSDWMLGGGGAWW